jgi:class 3 adenylate cyclase
LVHGAARVGAIAERFLTGSVQPGKHDRVLATLMFSDIVDSTGRAPSEGDASWARVVERHDK